MSDLKRVNTRRNVYKMLIESHGKVEKCQGKVREFCVKNLGDTLYKIVNIDVESTKIVTKMQTMNRITKEILKMKNFENFGQNWANFDQKCLFLQKCDLFKITFCDIT